MAEVALAYRTARSRAEFASRYLEYLSQLLLRIDVDAIARIMEVFEDAAANGRTLFFIGNGGSASVASHLANDIMVGTRAVGLPPIRAISLVDNVPVMTAIANDYDYALVFVQQLETLMRPEDILMALSASGNSTNVIEAVGYANRLGAVTIGCTGFDGGKLRGMVDINLHVPAPHGAYGPVEDIFMVLDHLVAAYLRLQRRGEP